MSDTPQITHVELPQLDDVDLLQIMQLSREGDRREGILFRQNKGRFQLPGAGHEALAAVVRSLNEDDLVFPHYRDRALLLARGTPNRDIALAYFAKADAMGGGRQLPSHFDDRQRNFVSCASPTGLQCLPAAGAAWAQQLQGSDAITLCCLGDATMRQGEFYEAVCFALQEKLPIIFLVEDNGYGISTKTDRMNPYLIGALDSSHVVKVDGRNVEQIHQSMSKSTRKARSGGGPTVILAQLDRLYSHTSSDDQRRYRAPEEIEEMWKRDPVAGLREKLVNAKSITGLEWDQMVTATKEQVYNDYKLALAAADPREQDAGSHLYSDQEFPSSRSGLPQANDCTVVAAIKHTLSDLLASDPRVLMFGEDIEDPKGGVFGMTKSLSETYPARVVNSPLAEASIAGIGSGLAVRGLRPIVELQFIDFVGPAFNQIVNQMATLRWRSRGGWSCPIVVIAPYGAYLPCGGPWHSQCNESWFLHTPGLRVIVPSTANDAAALLRCAVNSDDPVLFLVPKHLFHVKFPTMPDIEVCFGKAAVRREGRDVTIVTWGNGTELALNAADLVACEDGLEARVIDLRTLAPWDRAAVAGSVEETGNLIVVQEDNRSCSLGESIITEMTGDGALWSKLRGPPILIARRDEPIGFHENLEMAVLPTCEDVVEAIRASQYD